jgi:transcriptional antiterminator NusG
VSETGMLPEGQQIDGKIEMLENLMSEQRLYKKGEFVGMVDRSQLADPVEVPIPKRWYLLRVFPNREFRVMKTFGQRGISGWLPLMTTPQEFRRYHRGYEYIDRQNVTSPMISGVILIPDHELADDRVHRWREVDGVIGIYRMDECVPFLTPDHIGDLRNIEAIGNTPKSKRARAFEVGELVRVVNGPFRDFCALVERFASKGRLGVGVEIFGRITPIEIDESDIEAVKAR